MNLYNTLIRRKEEFDPRNPGEVKLYCCGPTVYNYAHIGNLRTYVFEDLLRRALEASGYVVKHVMNITDVGHLTSDADEGEDKMLKGARREKKTVWEIAEFYTKAFMDDMVRLNLLHPTLTCKATDHIAEMIQLIQRLEKKGLTYNAGGNVYFDTSKFEDYGKLARLDLQELKAGARIMVDKNKKNPYDFVLWFTESKHGNQDMQWESPWGRGFPGWHIECSAMAIKYLGEQLDIHCGGIDHISVHHTNEIAQSEGAIGKKPWVKTWMHGNFLTIDNREEKGAFDKKTGDETIYEADVDVIEKKLNEKINVMPPEEDAKKMAKSGENFITLQTLIDKGFDALDYRYSCLQTHYRKEKFFSWEALKAAKKGLSRLLNKTQELGDKEGDADEKYWNKFMEAVEDDLNLPEALAVVWELVDDSKISAPDKLTTLKKCDTILGLKLEEPVTFTVPDSVEVLKLERDEAREKKDWKKSDELRAKIEAAGYEVRDLPRGGSEVKPK